MGPRPRAVGDGPPRAIAPCCTPDRYGNRIDRVEYHPAYHHLMTAAISRGLHGSAWADGRPGAHVLRCAKIIVWSPVDYGHMCPLSMSYAVMPALRATPEVAALWEPRLTSRGLRRARSPRQREAVSPPVWR